MNKSNLIASEVVNEQIRRMVEQEKKNTEVVIPPDFLQACPFIDKEKLLDAALRMAIIMKISILARFN